MFENLNARIPTQFSVETPLPLQACNPGPSATRHAMSNVPQSSVQRALAALRRSHIIAEEKPIACCPECCSAQVEILSECGECRGDATGFVIYCHQDARQAETEGTLMLSFGAFYDGQGADEGDTSGRAAAEEERPEADEEEDGPTEGDMAHSVACRGLGETVVAAFRSEGLEVVWDGDPGSRVEVRGIPAGAADRVVFALASPADAAWVDSICAMRVDKGLPPEARCSHTCGAGVRPCPHGVFLDLEVAGGCECCPPKP